MPHIPNLKEKTLRYPGHVEKILMLKEAGFFKTDPVDVGGAQIKPLDFTSRILFEDWKLGETEEELTVMRITIKGRDTEGNSKEVISNLHDVYDKKTNTSSMAVAANWKSSISARHRMQNICW